MPFLEDANFWHWWILGIVLVIVEAVAPGAVFIWMGAAAGLVGVVLLIAPNLAWQFQLLMFAVLSIGSIAGWRAYQKKHPPVSDQPTLNRRGEQYVGRLVVLDEALVNNTGKIKIDDSTWKVEGDDMPAGTRVKVVGVDGIVLQVEAA